MEADLDREIAAAHELEERELMRELGPAGDEDIEAELEQQLMKEFKSQLSTDEQSLMKSFASVQAGGRTRSRVNRMRAECAAWGGSAPERQEEEDEEAYAFEEELASAAADLSVLQDWRVADMDIQAELDLEIAGDLDPSPTTTVTSEQKTLDEDQQSEYE